MTTPRRATRDETNAEPRNEQRVRVVRQRDPAAHGGVQQRRLEALRSG